MSVDEKSDEKDEVRKLMEIADKLYHSGDLSKCKEMYQAIAAKYPGCVDACLNYSNLIRAHGDLANALKELERGLSICGNDYKLLCNQGKLLNELGRQREAKVVLEKAIGEYDSDSYTWNNLGNSHYELEELSLALEAYERATMLEPKCPDAEDNRVRTIWRLQGHPDNLPSSNHVFVTGTCKPCGQRFKILASKVLATYKLTCPNCGVEWNGTALRLMAKALLVHL